MATIVLLKRKENKQKGGRREEGRRKEEKGRNMHIELISDSSII